MSKMAKSTSNSLAIVWLRNDLRLHDHEGLLIGQKCASKIIPIYCFDPRHFKGTWNYYFPKTGLHRAKLLVQSISNLRETLQTNGSNLLVKQGKPEDVIPELIKSLKFEKYSLVFQEEVTKEELDVEIALRKKCKSLGVNICTYWGATLYHKADLPYSIKRIPDTYTEFRKGVESQSRPRDVLQMPNKLLPFPDNLDNGSIPSLAELGLDDVTPDKRTAFPFEGGETKGLERIKSYFWDNNQIATYKETRNGLIGESYSTKVSPWLSLGCISPRYIYEQVKKYEDERMANHSTYWVLFELIWRDYFRFVCLKYGDRVFYPTGIKGLRIPWKKDIPLFEKWRDGKTGIPFVDANMRELKETGWMSNRGRQNVASFLVKDLHLDWRLGAEWFESALLDHDVCSNYGNWNYSAGIGNDPRENRKFNIVKQSHDYDSQGDYVRLWVPELSGIKGSMVHTPWKLTSAQMEAANFSPGETYFNPVVIAPEWGRHDHKGKQSYEKEKRWSSQNKTKQRGMDFYFNSNKKL